MGVNAVLKFFIAVRSQGKNEKKKKALSKKTVTFMIKRSHAFFDSYISVKTSVALFIIPGTRYNRCTHSLSQTMLNVNKWTSMTLQENVSHIYIIHAKR